MQIVKLSWCAGHRANPIPDGLAAAECGDDGQAGAQQLLDATEHSLPGRLGCPAEAAGPHQGCFEAVCTGLGTTTHLELWNVVSRVSSRVCAMPVDGLVS